MLKKTTLLIPIFLCLSLCIQATEKEHSSAKVYAQIEDLCHPTPEDFYLIQDYLSNGEREGLEKLKYTASRQRNLKIIGTTPHETPEFGVIPVNTTIDDKENCLVLYASFNLHFPEGLRRLMRIVKESDFKGHILYHIGGWPDLKGGSLPLAHVPHSFKACCFKEAEELGYKRVLWLDCSVIPLVSLNAIFEMIAEKGYFSMKNCHQVGPYCNAETAAYFELTLEETYDIISCQAGFLGVDLTTELGREIIDLWYSAAHDKDAFFSARSDQTALSLILHQCSLDCLPNLTENHFRSRNSSSTEEIPERAHPRDDTLFLVDRDFVRY